MHSVPRRWASLGAVCSLVGASCGSGAKFQSDPKFSGASMQSRAVLVLPIAVTDELGDDRTGIVLDRESRHRATRLACNSAVELREDVHIVCFDRSDLASVAPLLRSILLDYARDQPTSAERWHELARRTGAGYVLLFRPEDVRASQSVSKPSGPWSVAVVAPSVPLVVVIPAAEGAGPHVASVSTTRAYTLSSSLVDLREGKVVRTGVHSRKDSTATADPPEASQHLHAIMRDLMKGLLER
jgi:hypothetical protein